MKDARCRIQDIKKRKEERGKKGQGIINLKKIVV